MLPLLLAVLSTCLPLSGVLPPTREDAVAAAKAIAATPETIAENCLQEDQLASIRALLQEAVTETAFEEIVADYVQDVQTYVPDTLYAFVARMAYWAQRATIAKERMQLIAAELKEQTWVENVLCADDICKKVDGYYDFFDEHHVDLYCYTDNSTKRCTDPNYVCSSGGECRRDTWNYEDLGCDAGCALATVTSFDMPGIAEICILENATNACPETDMYCNGTGICEHRAWRDVYVFVLDSEPVGTPSVYSAFVDNPCATRAHHYGISTQIADERNVTTANIHWDTFACTGTRDWDGIDPRATGHLPLLSRASVSAHEPRLIQATTNSSTCHDAGYDHFHTILEPFVSWLNETSPRATFAKNLTTLDCANVDAQKIWYGCTPPDTTWDAGNAYYNCERWQAYTRFGTGYVTTTDGSLMPYDYDLIYENAQGIRAICDEKHLLLCYAVVTSEDYA